MERRRSERISFTMEAHIVSRSINCRGTVKELSAEGIRLLLHSEMLTVGIPPSTLFMLELTGSENRKMSLQCRLLRSEAGIESDSAHQEVALEILDSSQEYNEFLRSLMQ